MSKEKPEEVIEEVAPAEEVVEAPAPAPAPVEEEPEPLVLVFDEQSVPRWLKDLNDRRRSTFDVVRMTGFGMENLSHANLLVDLGIAALVPGGVIIVPEGYAYLVESRGLSKAKGFKEKGFFAFQ